MFLTQVPDTKSIGKSLYDGLMDLYDEVGHYWESLETLTFSGENGQENIVGIMKYFRNDPPLSIAGVVVSAIEDYQAGTRRFKDGTVEKLSLPEANVVKFLFEDGSWVCVRPSGTEPKCKFYFWGKEGLGGRGRVVVECVVTRCYESVLIFGSCYTTLVDIAQ
ncbi:hypothetical protein [Sporosarcina psychrophila]|uniref:hypothetical protein n=1 Tax=Sporosarcina psychrophila TaxID=1476 RepID=UPI0018D4310F|nr:hypothetical protein [Sporosarcina psychrophila]